MDYFSRIVVRIWWAKSTCSFDYGFFRYSCCWKLCSKRLASHSGLAAEMRLLRDVNRKPRNLLWQPGLKCIRPFFFFFFLHFKALLHSRKTAGTFAPTAGPPNSQLPGAAVTRAATTAAVQVPWESRAGCGPARFVLSTAACGWAAASGTPRPPLTPASYHYWQRQVLLTTVHRVDTLVLAEVIFFYFFFFPLFFLVFFPLLRLWLQPPWSWNTNNVKSCLMQLLGEVRTLLGERRGKVRGCSLCTRPRTSALFEDLSL